MGKRHYDVVCGIITNENDEYLVALRKMHQEHGGLWEFPGGKIELHEQVHQALCRELYEELDIEVLEATAWLQVNYEYPLYHVTLHVWRIVDYEGEPLGHEGQYVRWAPLSVLQTLTFPSANRAIIDSLLSERHQ